MDVPRKLRALSLFAGIGGAELALADYVRTVAYCEIDSFCVSVLLSRMADGRLPVAPIWDDVRTLDGTALRGCVDIVIGGFPCQDVSKAGRCAGLDGERSGLYRELVRLVAQTQPVFVYLENVAAIRRHAHRVIGELADMGFDSRWGHVSAQHAGAPHIRDRWWCLAANPNRVRLWQQSERDQRRPTISGHPEPVDDGATRDVAHTTQHRELQPQGSEPAKWRWFSDRCGAGNWWRCDMPEPAFRRVVDGVPHGLDATRRINRSVRFHALGNAWVPEQARLAFETLIGVGGAR